MMAVAAFAAFVLLGNELTAEVAFTSLALFDILKMPMLDLGWIVGSMVKAYVALSRVSAYLTTPELETEGISVGRTPPAAGSSEPAIKVTKASFVWGQGQPPNMERKEVKRICSDLDKALQVGAISDSRHTALVHDAHPMAPCNLWRPSSADNVGADEGIGGRWHRQLQQGRLQAAGHRAQPPLRGTAGGGRECGLRYCKRYGCGLDFFPFKSSLLFGLMTFNLLHFRQDISALCSAGGDDADGSEGRLDGSRHRAKRIGVLRLANAVHRERDRVSQQRLAFSGYIP